MTVWHWLVHQGGIDYGTRYGAWVPYNFWSGIAGSFLIGVLAWLMALVHRRIGRHAAVARESADKALRIAADTHKALTGITHPDAPASAPVEQEKR